MWALECPFLTRNFAKDESTIKKTSEVYKSYPFPIQVGIKMVLLATPCW